MHDIDRTLEELEAEDDANFYGRAQPEVELEGHEDWQELEDDDGQEFEDEEEFEFEDEGEFEDEDEDELEYEYEFEGEDEGDPLMLSDSEELELASDLLNVSDDEELEQFLGKLFRKVKRRARKVVRRGRRLFKKGVYRRLKRGFKRVAKRALPIAGAGVGGYFGGPMGAKVGAKVTPAIGRIFGMELESLAPEQQELEAARRLVRMATSATSHAARGSQTSASPQRIVRGSMQKAARRHAPGLLRPISPAGARRPSDARKRQQARKRSSPHKRSSGRWIRRGNTIVILGVGD